MVSDEGYASRPAKGSNSTLWIVLAVVAAALVMMCMVGGVLIALLLPAVQQAREAARRTQAKGHMKQIGLGAHNFHDTHGHFPPAAADGSDDPDVIAPISFHTAILTYMEQGALYESINKSVPWDDAVNRTAYATAFRQYLSPQFEEQTGPNGYAVTHFVPNTQLVVDGKGLPMSEIPDGTSNTVLTGQVNAAFPAWGDPTNGRDPANGFRGGPTALGGRSGGAMIGMADGSVRFVSENTSPDVAAALASPAGEEAIPAGSF